MMNIQFISRKNSKLFLEAKIKKQQQQGNKTKQKNLREDRRKRRNLKKKKEKQEGGMENKGNLYLIEPWGIWSTRNDR